MKTLVLALVCAMLLIAAPDAFSGEKVPQLQLSVTGSNQTVNFSCKDFVACNDGSPNIYIDCGATASASTGFPIVSGRCLNLKLNEGCGVLNYIGAAACTKPACLNLACAK